MKKCLLLIVYILCTSLTSAFDNGINFRAQMSDSNSTQKIMLNGNYAAGEAIEGYFINTMLEGVIEGRLVKGGLSVVDPEILTLYSEKAKQSLLERKYPSGNIDSISYGIRMDLGLSFSIEPVFISADADSITLLFKYCVFTLNSKNNDNYSDMDYNVNAHFEHIRAALNKPQSFDFINQYFNEHDIVFCFTTKNSNQLKVGKILFDQVIESCGKSVLMNADIKIEGDFRIEQVPDQKMVFNFFRPPFDQRVQCRTLPSGNILVNETDGRKINLPVNVYQFRFSFPFHLYNEEKNIKYSSYKTKEQVFRSDYNIIIVPQAYTKDTLYADAFFYYSKMNIDEVVRWTPAKIRIAISQSEPLRIQLPKENWSANFTRNDENYEIYGFSDYEKYTNEYIVFDFKSTK